MKRFYFILLASTAGVFAFLGKLDVAGPSIPNVPILETIDQERIFETKPFWADEFDYTGLPDSARWSYDIGGSGWGNHELQYYTHNAKNAYVAKGVLKITAVNENKEGMEYSSARLVSKNKGDFLYGRFEVKAKLPKGKGTWPAAWMLPTDWAYGDWPRSGEIDIIEHVGFNQNSVHMSVHTQAYNHTIKTEKTSFKMVPGVSEEFHLYRIDWTPEAIRGYVDDLLLFEFMNEGKGLEGWPFDKRFHLLLNLAVGGDWGGVQGVDPDVFPQSMEVDYVRVFRLADDL